MPLHLIPMLVLLVDKTPEDNDVVAGPWGAVIVVALIVATAGTEPGAVFKRASLLPAIIPRKGVESSPWLHPAVSGPHSPPSHHPQGRKQQIEPFPIALAPAN